MFSSLILSQIITDALYTIVQTNLNHIQTLQISLNIGRIANQGI